MNIAHILTLVLLTSITFFKAGDNTLHSLHYLAYTNVLNTAFKSCINHTNLEEEPPDEAASVCNILVSLEYLSRHREEQSMYNFMLNHQLVNTNKMNKERFSELFPQICLRPESKNIATKNCRILSIAARSNNEFAATTADGFLFRWNMNNHTTTETFDGIIDFIAIDQDTVFFVRKESYQVEYFSWDSPDLSSYTSLTHNIHRGKITLLSLIPEHNKLFVGDSLGFLSIWNTTTRECLHCFHYTNASLSALALNPTSELLISTGWDAVISIVYPTSKELSQFVLIDTRAMIKKMFFTTTDTLLCVDLLGKLRTLTLSHNKISNTILIDKIDTIFPFPHISNSALLIDRMNTILFLYIQPGLQQKAITYPLFSCVHEPTALWVSENGLIITGHRNGSILVDYSLWGLFSLHPFQLKLLLLLQEYKKNNTYTTLSFTWLMLFLSLPNEYQEQFYDILSQQSKADLLEYNLCCTFTKRKK